MTAANWPLQLDDNALEKKRAGKGVSPPPGSKPQRPRTEVTMRSAVKQYSDSRPKRKRAEIGLDINEVSEVLRYDPQTGDFVWIGGRGMSSPGRRAGCVNGRGYVTLQVCGRKMLAHRIAWALFHGEWPKGVIDHINGDTADNRIQNLRDVSERINQRNRCTGHGITKFRKGWRVYVASKHVGCFKCFGQAVNERNRKRIEAGYTQRRVGNWRAVGDLARKLVLDMAERKAKERQEADK